jgi:dGTPase
VRKFGVYDDDRPVFDWLRTGAPGRRQCFEAQVMDLADDIAYSVHDVEDGIVAGRVELVDLADRGLRSDVWETARAWYHPGVPDEVLEEAWRRLTSLAGWPDTAYDGSRAALGSLKNLTSSLIGRFCAATTEATHAAYGAAPLSRYAADLVVPEDTVLEIGVLKSIAAHLVMEAAERVGVMATQRELLADLVAAIRAAGPSVMEPMFQADFAEADDDAARLRVVVDQVASLTDASAVSWHGHLC